MVGKVLECLHLPDSRIDSACLALLLLYCPNLVELNISGHNFTTIDPLVNVYMAQQCKIHTLSLVYRAGGSVDDIPEQLTALHRQNHHLSLRQLAIHLITVREANYNAPKCTTTAANLAIALTELPTLSFVHLTTIRPSRTASARLYPLPLGFSVRIGHQPLPLQSKLAFLSIVHSKSNRCSDEQGGEGSSIWSRLDTLVMAHIFHSVVSPLHGMLSVLNNLNENVSRVNSPARCVHL